MPECKNTKKQKSKVTLMMLLTKKCKKIIPINFFLLTL